MSIALIDIAVLYAIFSIICTVLVIFIVEPLNKSFPIKRALLPKWLMLLLSPVMPVLIAGFLVGSFIRIKHSKKDVSK